MSRSGERIPIWHLLPLCLVFAAACLTGAHPNAPNGKLFIADAAELVRLENSGFSFSELAFGENKAAKKNSELKKVAGYAQIVNSLEGDLNALQKSDQKLGIGMAYAHRLFDSGWLSSPHSFYELIGVVLRLDRAPFVPDSCGEVRLIYRLAYRADGIYSRLPMTVNAVFLALDGENKHRDCSRVALHWQNLPQSILKNRSQLKPANLKSLEVNMQSVRWPSTVRPDFGGYAEYILRVFKKQSGKYAPAALENTPDARRIRKSTELRSELAAWIRENLAAIDQGIAVLPQKFLAKKVTSVALNGPARLANLPFRQIFSEAELEALAKQGKYTASPRWLLRRLDDQTCSGCHQGRAVAGFHFTGSDREPRRAGVARAMEGASDREPRRAGVARAMEGASDREPGRAETDAVNAIFNPASAHFFADQRRREEFAQAVANRSSGDISREISWRSDHEAGTFGAFCDTTAKGPPNFGCSDGYTCLALNNDENLHNPGICQPVKVVAGAACKSGVAKSDINPHKDRLVRAKNISCGTGYICQNVPVGFPGGMCSNGCKNVGSGEVCGSIANLQGFNDCLAERKPFAACLSGNVRPGTLKACDAEHACRPDYICAKISTGKGGCIPPYFLFQLRIDGHNF